MTNGSERIPEYEPCGRGICAANAGHDGTCAEASGWAYDELTEIAIAREAHTAHPAKWASCPECNRFSAHPWQQTHGTQNGTFYTWGGVCRTHGPWQEST